MSDLELIMLEEETTFFNSVFSKIFHKKGQEAPCLEKVRQMAFVEVKFPESSGILISKTPSLSLSGLIANLGMYLIIWCRRYKNNTFSFLFLGGLMSLYIGLSVLSIMEVIFWCYRGLLAVSRNIREHHASCQLN